MRRDLSSCSHLQYIVTFRTSWTRFVNVKHHNVENAIRVNLQRLRNEGCGRRRDKPVIAIDRSKSVRFRRAVEIDCDVRRTTLMEGLVRKGLITGKVVPNVPTAQP
jgi:hypothetical protein